METCRKPIVMALLLLLIHLLMLQTGGAIAERNDKDFSSVKMDPGKIILEAVTITGSGNETRLSASAVEEDPSKIDDKILSLLSKREIPRGRRSRQTSSSNSDQDVEQSRTVIVNVEDEDDLEKLKHVIAEYEPLKIASGKAKRKIVDVSDDTYDIHNVSSNKDAGSATDFERTYHEVLRNISRNVPLLLPNNAGVTLNPYLSQAMKHLKQVYIPEATIHTTTSDETNKSQTDVRASYAPSFLKQKKKKKNNNSLKKSLQPNRTVTASPVAGSKLDEEITNTNESIATREHFKVPSERRAKPKNGLEYDLSSNIYTDSTENQENRRDLSPPIASPFASRSNYNDAYNAFVHDLNERQPNFSSDSNILHLSSTYNKVPRPFVVSQLSNTDDANANTETSYKKPNFTPVDVVKPQQILRSSANVPPLVLPTDLFTPSPIRHYIPIKRANRLNLHGNSATIVNKLSANSIGRETTIESPSSADYTVPYTNVIGTTRIPTVVANGRQSTGVSDYYIAEKPAEQIVAKTTATYVPGQLYTLQRQKNPQAALKTGLLPRVATDYNSPDNGRLKSNANPGLALYNQFASLYSANAPPNVLHTPKPIAGDYRDFVQPVSLPRAVTPQQVSALPYATLKPVAFNPIRPALLKIQPITTPKPLAPYYDSRLLVSQDVGGKKLSVDDDDEEDIKVKKQPHVEDDTNETEEKVVDDNGSHGSYKTQINHATTINPDKIQKASSERQKQKDREEDHYQEQRGGYRDQDKHYGSHDKEDGTDEKYDNSQENDDEEDVDETQEDEYINAGKEEGKEDNHERNHDYHRYNEYKYDRDDPEEQGEKQQIRHDRKEYDEERDQPDKYDYDNYNKYDTDIKYKPVSDDKYSNSPRSNEARVGNKENDDSHNWKKFGRYDRYKKNQRDHKDEDESATEDKLVAQRSKVQHARRQGEKDERKRNRESNIAYKPKYRYEAIPKDSRHVEQKHERYSETNPKHIRWEYNHHQRRVNDDHRDHHKFDNEGRKNDEKEVPDHVHGETQEHAHKHEEHHEKKPHGDHKFEEGNGAEYEEEHHGDKGEKGHKGYKAWHEHEKAEKGHHDKEEASKEYDEKDGEEKKHEEEGGYHEKHHQGEAGKKSAEFGEQGEHQKGHNTKGEHSVHKKDEYEKKTEFFDEFHEDGGTEKHGEHHHEHESEKGGHEKKGHHDSAEHEEKYGKEHKYDKGDHHHEHKGHKVADGHDHHYDRDEKHGKKEGHEHGKKWSYTKSSDHKHR